MLPAFATVDALADRLPSGVADADVPRAQAALDDASALIRAEASKDWSTDGELDADLPDIVRTVCLRAALRAFTNPTGVTQQSAGPFGVSYANSSSDVYLTAADKAQIRGAAGKPGLSTISTTRGCIETAPVACADPWGVADEYVDVEPSGEPLPFL